MTNSILTNVSALTALQSLNQTQANLQTTETQISTGLKISTAADNAAYWSIGAKMNSQVGALGAVSDALNESGALLSTMTTALNSTLTIMQAIKNDLVDASNAGADTSSIETDIQSQQQALLSIGQSANFNGVNFLNVATSSTVNLVASYDSSTGVSFIGVNTADTQLFNTASTTATAGILGAAGSNSGVSILNIDLTNFNSTGTAATAGDIANMLADVELAISSITTASSTLGATSTNITNQSTFVTSLSNSLTNGVSALVDADMNQASTRLSALQVQQQLGIQALSIANSNTQLILKLFGQ